MADCLQPQVIPSPQPDECLESGDRRRILVVDDEPHIRTAVRAVLENARFDVTEARDGVQALLKVGLGKEMPSLIILDLAMPGLDGMELMEALGQLRIVERPVVIVFTANWSVANSTRAAELGARAILSKPLRPAQLLEAVRYCLANAASSAVVTPQAPPLWQEFN